MFSAFFRSLKQEFAGYNSKKLLADMMAGLTVCAVALPLALAFGVSSGASAASGLVTAIIAGVVIAILGGASYQISGPTGAMSAVLVGIVAEYGLQGVFFACFAAGVLLLLASSFARTSSTELYPSRTPTIASILTSLTQNSLIVIQPPYLSVFLLLPVLFCILPGLHWKSRLHGKQYQYPPAFLYL